MASAEHRIDIPIEELELWWPECCIYDVPEILRKVKPEAYTPQLMSIGPLHHNDEKLKPMEKQKKLYYRYFETRLLDSHRNEALTKFKRFIESRENDIRRCYSKKCDFSKQELVEMILLDSVFIMELFLRKHIQPREDRSNQTKQEKDLLFSKRWISGGILQDLLLLENQLPMFVLVELYNTVVLDPDKLSCQSFHMLACHYFEDRIYLLQKVHASEDKLHIYKKSQNFVALIRYCWLPNDPKSYFQQGESSSKDVKTARKLDEAGITFEKSKHQHLLGVKFEKKNFLYKFPCLSTIPRTNIFKSRLLIPQLMVDDGTEILLRNLIALEQCHYPTSEAYICHFLYLMDCLVDTKKDVEFLIEREIIVKNVGSSKEVATMLNGICKNVHIGSSCYTEIMKRPNKHYDLGWNHTMAKLKSVYFSDLWRGSATVVGTAIVLFSLIDIVQTLMKIEE